MTKGAILVRHQVQVLKDAGWKIADVVRKVGKSRSFVNKWWNREELEDASRSGRPPRFTRAMKKKVVHGLWHRGRGQPVRSVSGTLGYSRESARRIAHESGLLAKHRHHHPFLSDKHKSSRVAFAKEHKNTDFSKVLYVDEKKVEINPSPNRFNDFAWVYPGEEPAGRPKFKHQPKLNVCAGIMLGGRSEIHIFPENMDRFFYKKVIEQTLLPAGLKLGGKGWKLCQDRDPKHTSKICKQLLADEHVPILWNPACSGDVMPMENIWSMFNTELFKLKPTSIKDLAKKIKMAWNNIPQIFIDDTIKSIPGRLQEVISLKGGWTHH